MNICTVGLAFITKKSFSIFVCIMIDYLFFIVLGLATLFLIFLWTTKKSVKTGFAKDENNNWIPDALEKKFKFIFTFENIIILALGISIGYLLTKTSFLN